MDPTGDEPRERDLQSQLAELLECERELDRLLSAAQEEGRRKVEDAKAAAAAAAADIEVSLDEEARRVRSSIEDRADAGVREILERSRERATLFENVSDEQVEAVADSAFLRLIARDGRS